VAALSALVVRLAGPGLSAVRVIDSHTEGEPTRVVISGGPDLGRGTLAERRERFRRAHDDVRRALILEPRGHAAQVGALLCPPDDPAATSGVIFFNNTGYLGMCGHGAMGVAVTLAYLGREVGEAVRLDTPVGGVNVTLAGRNEATLENVPSYRLHADLRVDVEGYPPVTGDVAWGGNWFFLAYWPHTPIEPAAIPALTDACRRIRAALAAAGVTGADGAEIDHVELYSHDAGSGADSRNFVLCPGGEYDRSPCGTGTSAKLACLAARGELAPGAAWVQESVTGGRFTARYAPAGAGCVVAHVTGHAYVTMDAAIVRQDGDPFRNGLRNGLRDGLRDGFHGT
jgi:4-hydroxyproline epimerase